MARQTANEAFEALKTFMVENYGAKIASGGKEIIKRCHFCGDSRDPTSKHLYIGLKPDGSIAYNCFKCNTSGYVDGNFFRSLGCYDVDLITLCQENNRSKSSYIESTNKRKIARSKDPILVYRDAPETQKKLEHLRKRLGYPFQFEDLARFKIILNLYDYINSNTVGTLTRNKNICDQIDQFFLGFLSTDNAYIIMRRLVPEGKLHPNIDSRYINYNIYGINDSSSRYYILPTQIDPNRKVIINIAEGPFDILGVYLNTNSIKDNAIFAAIGGKSYMSIVKYFIINYGFMDFELHVYVDNDVDNYEMYKLADLIKPFRPIVYIHRNLFPGEKDFGVIKDRIDERIVKL